MATQQQLAEHLDMSQQQISNIMARLGIDWKTACMDDVRLAYLRHLRVVASEHETREGESLTGERILTERVDRELKQMALEEKKGELVNVEQLEPELVNMASAFRTELLVCDERLKAVIDARYGIDLDINLLNEYTHGALAQLVRHDVIKGKG